MKYIQKPIYEPKVRALEYGELALNIYTSCNHGCKYCYAAKNAKRWGKEWGNPEPRENIVESVKRQIKRENLHNRLIHLCFTCDPYPADIDTTSTREVIKVIKESGNNVQILTKGGFRAERDFDLLGPGDWFGVTVSGNEEQMKQNEPRAASRYERLDSLLKAHFVHGLKTWVSCEPVFNTLEVYGIIEGMPFIDLLKIGKLNYAPSSIDWAHFGRECERLCQKYSRNYYIKDDLRREMGRL